MDDNHCVPPDDEQLRKIQYEYQMQMARFWAELQTRLREYEDEIKAAQRDYVDRMRDAASDGAETEGVSSRATGKVIDEKEQDGTQSKTT